jgi:type II secretory pathway component GspD/PulD (secretin)
MKNCILGSLVLIGLCAPVTGAQDEGPASRIKRTTYVVQNGVAKDLADVLGKYFKGEAGVQFVAEPESNCLLITAPPAILEEVFRTLKVLDRQPRMVAVQILLVEVPEKKRADGKADSNGKKLSEKDLSGSAEEIEAKVLELQKKGTIGGLKRVRLSVLENQSGSVAVMENKPYVVGTTRGAGGGPGGRGGPPSASMVNYRNLGTTVRITPRVNDEGRVLLAIHVEDARANSTKDGVKIGEADDGAAVNAAQFVNASLESKLAVPSGKAVVAEGVKVNSRSEDSHIVVIVSAKVVERGAKGGGANR